MSEELRKQEVANDSIREQDVKLIAEHVVMDTKDGKHYDFIAFKVVLSDGTSVPVKVDRTATSLLYSALK